MSDHDRRNTHHELVGDVLRVMRQLASEGMTMIVITHEDGVRPRHRRPVMFMNKGRIVEDGRPGVIFAAPTNERTRVFLQSVLDRNAELESAGATSTSGE